MNAESNTQTFWGTGVRRPARPDAVRVFQHDPDLLAGIDGDTAQMLRRRVMARRLQLPIGAWSPPSGDRPLAGGLGLLVLDGLVCRSICVHGRDCPELLGGGDLLRPWEAEPAGLVDGTSTWRVLQPTTLAILDERFTGLLSRWPSIMVALLARSTQRSRALVLQLAIAQTRQAETRLLTLFWHLADRWGRITPHGVVLPLPLTHELLGQLACLHRPTTSTALQRLVRAGEIARGPDRGWTLLGRPPAHAGEPVAQSALAA
ncbi:MAG TPA: Crp/Fnr family transcriptional regulator [Solirubrobacteraceae bacterium]|nr:Crp/Fnr family transcriptional regulator [Solirubrobacteraceae bacterium]